MSLAQKLLPHKKTLKVSQLIVDKSAVCLQLDQKGS